MQNPGRTILGQPEEFIKVDVPNQGSEFNLARHSHELQSGPFKTCFVFYRKAEVHKNEFSPNSTSQTVMCVFVHYL